MSNKALHEAADALRRHEQAGKKLNEWHRISHGQQSRWLAKATVVLEAYREAQAAKDKAALAAVRAEEREACAPLEGGLRDCKRYAEDHDDEWVPHRVDDALAEAAAIRAQAAKDRAA